MVRAAESATPLSYKAPAIWSLTCSSNNFAFLAGFSSFFTVYSFWYKSNRGSPIKFSNSLYLNSTDRIYGEWIFGIISIYVLLWIVSVNLFDLMRTAWYRYMRFRIIKTKLFYISVPVMKDVRWSNHACLWFIIFSLFICSFIVLM